ncbi:MULTISPECIES: sterol desaturase family protein [unclassified Bradyrhizobium]|uniref:sterol desaturase family protein n=1 Tax=Bradyrhizobium TaxID=374 RepID=UPI0028E5F9EF|nr:MULTISPECIES: sterol desaturase family protein [unclassified Bradyrhizobium]
MNQSKLSYYAEFFIYPLVFAGLLLSDLASSGFDAHRRWLLAALGGAVLWTFAEYLVHRFLYHKVAVLKHLNGRHHAYPSDLIGAPSWVSVVIFVSFFALIARFSDLQTASGATAGLIAGYVLYLLVHDAVHHWQLTGQSPFHAWLRSCRLRHLRHHRDPVPGNFGVVTGLWDAVFGTMLATGRTRTRSA